MYLGEQVKFTSVHEKHNTTVTGLSCNEKNYSKEESVRIRSYKKQTIACNGIETTVS